ncbi:MAG: response regulator [Verrucomicrobiota bacterium]
MSKTILVIDDEVDLLSLLEEILQMEGYEVLTAKNTQQATEIWSENRERINILLTDVCISRVETGMAFAGKLQEEKPGLKVVYSSGHSHDTAISKYSLPDGAHFLQKPFQFEVLFARLKNCLAE